jgi:hypothetical protein
MKKSFKKYKRSFKCYALPNARKTRLGRKAAGTARRAAKTGKIEEAYERLVKAEAVGYDGLTHHLTSPRKAAQLLADAMLYEEKRRNHNEHAAKVAAKKAAGQDSPRKRWAIYPLTQSGQPGGEPIQICGIKRVAEMRAAEIGEWGGRNLGVFPYITPKP